MTFAGLGEDALQITFGRQRLQIGDGFLVSDAMSDLYHVAYYSAPGKAFDDESVVVQLDAGPLRFKGFRVGVRGSDEVDDGWNRKGIELAGIDAEYAVEGRGSIGLTRFEVRDAPLRPDSYEGMDVTSLRGQGNPFGPEGMAPLFLSGEYAVQRGGAGDIDANAWYLEAGYKFADAPWAPYLGYRYSLFSGDDPNTTANEAWWQLLPGFTRAWRTWYQGEIISNYLWHRNLRVHQLRATAAPMDGVSANLLLYDFDYDEPSGTDRNVARELDLIVDWTVIPNAGFSFINGIAWPDDGLVQSGGFGNETSMMFGIYGWVSY